MAKSWIFEIFSYPYDPDPEKFDPQLCKQLYDWKLESWVAAEGFGFERGPLLRAPLHALQH